MNENQRCYIVNRAHKDTKFSAVVQKWLFFRNLQTSTCTAMPLLMKQIGMYLTYETELYNE